MNYRRLLCRSFLIHLWTYLGRISCWIEGVEVNESEWSLYVVHLIQADMVHPVYQVGSLSHRDVIKPDYMSAVYPFSSNASIYFKWPHSISSNNLDYIVGILYSRYLDGHWLCITCHVIQMIFIFMWSDLICFIYTCVKPFWNLITIIINLIFMYPIYF